MQGFVHVAKFGSRPPGQPRKPGSGRRRGGIACEGDGLIEHDRYFEHKNSKLIQSGQPEGDPAQRLAAAAAAFGRHEVHLKHGRGSRQDAHQNHSRQDAHQNHFQDLGILAGE